ncbi:MAG TPA: hypothetical protein VGH43_18725 [Jatrophihabitans sp.]|jgi:hypothetical protein
MTRIDDLAEQLVREGYIDNEADARLAAIKIILAAEQHDGLVPVSNRGDGHEER